MIEARGLTKRYGDTLAVDDLSFSVESGRITGFLGPNGAGKTTTMRMILGLDRPTAGSVTVNGQPYASVKGNNLGVTFYDADGNPITDTTHQHDILVALEGIQFAVVLVIGFTAALFGPIVNLLGS